MSSVEFIFNEKSIIIQCTENDKMKNIIEKFIGKTNIDINSVFFLNEGKTIDEESMFSEIKKENNQNNQIKILVYFIEQAENDIAVKSKNIICPICQENIRIEINDYKIYLFGCKNGHEINGILLDEFEKTQNINLSKITCQYCNENNKGNTFGNKFYTCFVCGKDLCPLCKSKHDKSHTILNYDVKNYYCKKHNDPYIKYCNECKTNICLLCENEHINHKNESFGNMMPNIEEIKRKMLELRKSIDIFNDNIKEIMSKLIKVKDNLEIYYKINYDILNNYEPKNRNYIILQNINQINTNNNKEINNINNDKDINNQTNSILNIYNRMFSKDISEINIVYDIDKKDKEIENNDTINIFGTDFVINNKNICKMIVNNKEYELQKKFNINNYKDKNLKIKLRGINKITNLSEMFSGCSSLISISNLSNWDISNVTSLSCMFYNCPSLTSLPDISNWNTSNIIDLSGLFYNCSSLKTLPDISKWNTSKVKDMSWLFRQCKLLSSLPDISKWDTNNTTDMSFMFSGCSKLTALPDISIWNTKNVNNLSYMFSGCSSLSTLPDISKWNIINVNDLSVMFKECSSLSQLPDISKWDTNNVTDINWIFRECSSLSKLPDISNWKTNNVSNMNGIFYGCKSLSSLPDISKWDTNNVIDMSWMFHECKLLSSLPDISQWNINNICDISSMFSGSNLNLKLTSEIKTKFKY